MVRRICQKTGLLEDRFGDLRIENGFTGCDAFDCIKQPEKARRLCSFLLSASLRLGVLALNFLTFPR